MSSIRPRDDNMKLWLVAGFFVEDRFFPSGASNMKWLLVVNSFSEDCSDIRRRYLESLPFLAPGLEQEIRRTILKPSFLDG